ncbi:hypothetical protein V0M98_34115 (plasmid) [Pseudomonas silesiensis]|uniref:hypothetical protein n=1 Tax=Pseudomonas silesiensis TaxID=1853130 RepID=UPI0030CC0CD4
MEISPSNIVLVLEKPMQSRALAPFAAERWPGRQVLVVYTFYLGLYEFRYPRGLSYADFPYVGELTWKIRTFGDPKLPDPRPLRFVVELMNGQVNPTELNPFEVIAGAGEIWFGCDPDHSGANGFDVLLSQILGDEEAAKERQALILRSYTEAEISRTLYNPTTTADPRYREWSNKGQAKRFFDYNFNLNSLALFGDCLRKVGVDTSDFGLSKYALQLLYWQRGQEPLSEGRIIRLMEDWVGTGRYKPCGIGSVASRASIMMQLRRAGLTAYEDRLTLITDRGNDFLNLLHPDCEDPDLSARLAAWQADWPNSKAAMARYLRTFFGKQARFKPARRSFFSVAADALPNSQTPKI